MVKKSKGKRHPVPSHDGTYCSLWGKSNLVWNKKHKGYMRHIRCLKRTKDPKFAAPRPKHRVLPCSKASKRRKYCK